MEEEEYHSDDAVSKSDITLFQRSPAHFKAKELRKTTPAMAFGSAFHTAILQPAVYAKEYVVMPEGVTKVHKAGKAFCAEAEANDQIVLSWDDSTTISNMRKAIRAHPTASDWLSFDGYSEISGFWVDEKTGLDCKLRADRIDSVHQVVIDLKTTTDARKEPFMYKIKDFKYHWQAAHYLNGVSAITGVPHKDFVFIAIEKEPPYAIGVYRLDDPTVFLGSEELKLLLDEFRECKEADKWPAYPVEMQSISMPESYMRRANLG